MTTVHVQRLIDRGDLPPARDEVLIEWPADDRRDGYGRLTFIAWWLAGDIRGQVFHTNPEEFVDRCEVPLVYGTKPKRVRLIDPA